MGSPQFMSHSYIFLVSQECSAVTNLLSTTSTLVGIQGCLSQEHEGTPSMYLQLKWCRGPWKCSFCSS